MIVSVNVSFLLILFVNSTIFFLNLVVDLVLVRVLEAPILNPLYSKPIDTVVLAETPFVIDVDYSEVSFWPLNVIVSILMVYLISSDLLYFLYQ